MNRAITYNSFYPLIDDILVINNARNAVYFSFFSFFLLVPTFLSLLLLFFFFETQYFTYYTLRFMTKIAIAPSLSLSLSLLQSNPFQSIQFIPPSFLFFCLLLLGFPFFFFFFICFLHDTIAYCIQINHNKFNDTSAARLTTLTRR